MDAIVEHISDGVILLDSEWRITDLNRRVELLFGQVKQRLVGLLWWDAFPYLKGTPTDEALREIAAGTIPRQVRIFHPPRYAWHDVTVIPNPDGLALVMREVTDIVRARQTDAVREAVRDVIDQAPLAISLMRGKELRVEVMNEAARKLLGGVSMEGRSIRSVLPELEGQGLFETLDEVLRTGKPYEAKAVPVAFDRDGSGRLQEGFFDLVYRPVLDPDGQISGVLSLSMEVTDLVREREQIERRRAELETVLTGMFGGVIITDSRGVITFINAVAEDLHGVSVTEIGTEDYTSTHNLLTEAGQPYPSADLPLARAILRHEVVENARWQIQRPDGSIVLVEGTARPVHDRDGAVVAGLLTFEQVQPGEMEADSVG